MEKSEINTEAESKIEVHHHKQMELCMNRPAYRQGRKFTAVKVYTVSAESQHLFVYGVPTINLRSELKSVFNKYGEIKTFHVVPQQKVEVFTECFHVHYNRIQSARIAKRLVDNKSFYGGILHVCYAPEYETLEETRTKLQQRKKDVLVRLNKYNAELLQDTKKFQVETSEGQGSEHEKSQKRKHTELEVPPLYNEEDPILSIKKKQKKNSEEYIAKYTSQLPDSNGGPNNKMNNSLRSHSKKFIPLPLRCKSSSETQVFGPQLPKSFDGSTLKVHKQDVKGGLGFLKKEIPVPKQNFMSKNQNCEKRIIFRSKILDKIS